MTAPVFFVDATALAAARPGDSIRIDGPEGRHAAGVMRLGHGEQVIVVDGSGRRADCRVSAVIGRDALEAEIVDLAFEAEPQPAFAVVQALPKGDRGELAVEVLTEIGADEIVPWAASRSVTQWRGERAAKSQRKWADAARASAKQSRRSRVPIVGDAVTTGHVVDRIADAALALVLDEEADLPVGEVDLPDEGTVLVIVGPEGGISAQEREAFFAAGAVPVRLGPTVLRTSTAGVVALAALLPRTQRWGARRQRMEG